MALLDLQGMENTDRDENHGGESELSLTGCGGHSGLSVLC
jgi:hypothetical protein